MTMTRRGDLSSIEWGYCSYCNRDVELRPNRRLASHTTHSGPAYQARTCEGSLRPPAPRPTEGDEDGST